MRAIARALQRLSSGSRINTGKDDPAGLAMANGLEAQRRGLIQSVRNLNDSRGFLETADGAMAEQTNMVQRMRELTVQASNGTLNDATRRYLDDECQALLAEFNRLTTQTQFNGVNLLDGSFGTKNIQAGSQKGQTIGLSLSSMQSSKVFLQSTLSGAGTFQSSVTIGLGSSPYATLTSDFNGDGFADIAVSDAIDGNLSIVLGNGNGTFQTRKTVGTGSGTYSISTTDLNGDGKLDLVTADSDDDTVSILVGKGDGTFNPRTTIRVGSSPFSVTLADVNGDGKADILSGDSNDGTVSIALGNGNGTFLARSTISAAPLTNFVLAKDFNGDGKIDIVTDGNFSISGTLSWAYIQIGNGNGTFKAPTTMVVGANALSMASGDINGDGKLDLLVADGNAGSVSILLGNGNGTFASRSTTQTENTPDNIALADLNGDGYLDLVSSNLLAVSLGNGNGTFQGRRTFSTQISSGVAISDMNGDGVLDLFTTEAAGTLYMGNGVTTVSAAQISLRATADAQSALTDLDTALAYINSARANIGAFQSRLGSATSVNMNTIENISAGRSQIMDADLAVETAEFARLQILHFAGIAVLSQANANAKLSLKLLENI